MARALFDPQRGYYTRNIKTVGARGDFSTSATLSPELGKRIAAWLKGARNVIEIGAGNGQLMEQVQRSLGLLKRWRMRFHMVETSPVLREQQQKRLRGVTWHETIESALAETGGDAWIYHNELLDAFPATLIEWRGGQWQEVWVPEELRPLEIDLASLTIREWLQSGFTGWKRGQMLTIDYGDDFPALYHRRPGGTLRGYLMHQRLYWPELLQSPGRMDLTADINFTDYRAWCRELGWKELSDQTLAEWAGIGDPEGAGGAFKCLIHQREAG